MGVYCNNVCFTDYLYYVTLILCKLFLLFAMLNQILLLRINNHRDKGSRNILF